jgi:hypothetical protein
VAIVKKVPSDANLAYLTNSDSEIGTKTDDDLSLDLAALKIQNSLSDDLDEHLWDYLWETNSNDILSELEKINTFDQFFDRMGVYGWSDPHEDCNEFFNLHQGYWTGDDPEYLSVWDCYCHAYPMACYINPINDSF